MHSNNHSPSVSRGLDLHVGDLGGEHEQLTDELLGTRELDDERVVVLGDQRPVEVVVVEQDDLGGPGAQDAVRVAREPRPELVERSASWPPQPVSYPSNPCRRGA